MKKVRNGLAVGALGVMLGAWWLRGVAGSAGKRMSPRRQAAGQNVQRAEPSMFRSMDQRRAG